MRSSITRLLVASNVAAFLFINPYLAGAQSLFSVLGLVPGNFHFWQPLTSMFLHGGIMHLLFNMLALWSLGVSLENKLGATRFSLLYFVSGIGGALFVLVLPGDPFAATIGASGAIVGLLGALAIFFPRAPLMVMFIPLQARTAALVFGGLTLLFALADRGSGISHAAHLGGLLSGLAYSWFFLRGPRPSFTFDRARSAERRLVYDPITRTYYLE